MDKNKNKCLECRADVDPEGSDDSRWASVVDGIVCWSCYESDIQSSSTINVVEDNKTTKIHVGNLDIFNEYGDPVENLTIKREWFTANAWRGYYSTTIEGWQDVLDGWTTGAYGDAIADRKQNFNEWAEALLTNEIYPPCSVAIVTDPTSNVFSTAVTVLVKKDDVESFRAWLADDYEDLHSALS